MRVFGCRHAVNEDSFRGNKPRGSLAVSKIFLFNGPMSYASDRRIDEVV
jgi:hypothetical protein